MAFITYSFSCPSAPPRSTTAKSPWSADTGGRRRREVSRQGPLVLFLHFQVSGGTRSHPPTWKRPLRKGRSASRPSRRVHCPDSDDFSVCVVIVVRC